MPCEILLPKNTFFGMNLKEGERKSISNDCDEIPDMTNKYTFYNITISVTCR